MQMYFTNKKGRPLMLAGRFVAEGSTITIDDSYLSDDLKKDAVPTSPVAAVKETAPAVSDATALLALSLKDLEPKLPALDAAKLQELLALETKAETPRKNVIDAINVEILKRAAAAKSTDQGAK